ncbi:MAG: hypothetical protein E6G53_00030 [Actinobacteria bacterium]|nr:MAG: hypothetical protein E6G53_00030 [Actinomycetota bacterium]
MRAGVPIALCAAVLLLAAGAGEAQAASWRIGAAKVDTTPPVFNAKQDLKDFPEVDPASQTTCPRSVYDGPRRWRFEEPYQDTDHSGDFNYGDPSNPSSTGDQYCDYNHNGRRDGIYLSGGIDHLAKAVHDRIDARAVAFSYRSRTVVLVSVIAQGIFENYIREARTEAESLAGKPPHRKSCGRIDQMVVSSNHNESSPDTIGLYGAPADPTGTAGLHSGIDETPATTAGARRYARSTSRSRTACARRSRTASRPPTTTASPRRSIPRSACSRPAPHTASRSSR